MPARASLRRAGRAGAGVGPGAGRRDTLGRVLEGSHPPSTLGTWRRRTVSGAIATSVAFGLRDATDERSRAQAVVSIARPDGPGPDDLLDLHFDPREPDGTWVVVRPWLLARGPA